VAATEQNRCAHHVTCRVCWLGFGVPEPGAELVLIAHGSTGHLPAETGRVSTTTQIYEGTNQIQRVVMARQLLKS
jgi:alkylation response protein AidB-like acyl-CoA dehydrogenase